MHRMRTLTIAYALALVTTSCSSDDDSFDSSRLDSFFGSPESLNEKADAFTDVLDVRHEFIVEPHRQSVTGDYVTDGAPNARVAGYLFAEQPGVNVTITVTPVSGKGNNALADNDPLVMLYALGHGRIAMANQGRGGAAETMSNVTLPNIGKGTTTYAVVVVESLGRAGSFQLELLRGDSQGCGVCKDTHECVENVCRPVAERKQFVIGGEQKAFFKFHSSWVFGAEHHQEKTWREACERWLERVVATVAPGTIVEEDSLDCGESNIQGTLAGTVLTSSPTVTILPPPHDAGYRLRTFPIGNNIQHRGQLQEWRAKCDQGLQTIRDRFGDDLIVVTCQRPRENNDSTFFSHAAALVKADSPHLDPH